MDIYQKKYLKYKKKYLGLLNQQGGRHTEELLYSIKDGFIFDYVENDFITEPIYLERIPADKAILINNVIYDYYYLLQALIFQNTVLDPINKQMISVSNLDLMEDMYVRDQKNIDDFKDIDDFENKFDKLRKKAIKENKKKDEIIDSINTKLENLIYEYELNIKYGFTNHIITKMHVEEELQTNISKNYIEFIESNELLDKKEKKKDLNYIDLKELNELLDTKEKKKNLSLLKDNNIINDIFKKPFNIMLNILSLNNKEIEILYSHKDENRIKIFDLTRNEIKKILSYDTHKQETILDFDIEIIRYFLLIYDISIQDDILKYNTKYQTSLIKIFRELNIEYMKKLLQLLPEELEKILKISNKDIMKKLLDQNIEIIKNILI